MIEEIENNNLKNSMANMKSDNKTDEIDICEIIISHIWIYK